VNPRLAIPPMVAAIVSAPIATIMFNFSTSYKLAGLGLNSLIAPITLASTNMTSFLVYLLTGVVIPAVITVVLYRVLLAAKWVESQQLQLEIV